MRRYTASMPNDAFARLVDRVAGNARSGASWAEGLLYHWLDAERSDTKRTVLLQERSAAPSSAARSNASPGWPPSARPM
ncbi:hypothetical protein [Parafrankia sp. EUN1f]|uniref:hypothetical protein n=1 Tax=Parafrankia sp. EUN1f TaxID=102897 RepID=UPI0012FAB6B5|nr:hypothetical protein [Parafrankia sp. EUN1f]